MEGGDFIYFARAISLNFFMRLIFIFLLAMVFAGRGSSAAGPVFVEGRGRGGGGLRGGAEGGGVWPRRGARAMAVAAVAAAVRRIRRAHGVGW